MASFLPSFSKSHAILLFATREWMLFPTDRILLHRIWENITVTHTPCFPQFSGQSEMIHKQVQLNGGGGGGEALRVAWG